MRGEGGDGERGGVETAKKRRGKRSVKGRWGGGVREIREENREEKKRIS